MIPEVERSSAAQEFGPTVRRFEAYAAQVDAKFAEAERLARNRRRLFRRCYRPLFPALRRARRILDWGCGSGELLLFLREASAAEIVGFEPSPSQLERARHSCRQAANVRCVGTPGEVDGVFDLVFSSHVVEHVPDAELTPFFAAMLARLAPEGRLVVATPNGLNPVAHAFYMASDRTHERMHSPFTLNEIVSPLGFEVCAVHRELPQSYDLPSLLKTVCWRLSSGFLKLLILSSAGGVRGLRFPLCTAPTIYCVIQRAGSRETRGGA